MPLETNCFKISSDLNPCGQFDQMGDYKRVGVCLPYSDIIKGSIIYDGCKVNFSALPGAFAIYDKSNVPFNGSIVSEEMGARFMKYNELVVFPAFEHTPENAYAIYKMSQGGERYVVILEQEKVNASGTNRFQVFGLESGLRFKESKSDKENQTANLVSLEQMNAGRPATYLFDTSDAVTIAKIDTLLKFDTIYGGTIATGGVVYLSIDIDKVGYIYLPNGAILTTSGGLIDTTYTGVGGAITYYIPKNAVVALLTGGYTAGSIFTNFAGELAVGGNSFLTSITANDVTSLVCNDCELLTTISANKAENITAPRCHLTDKAIADIIITAANEPTVQGVTFNFDEPDNSTYGAVFDYGVANYGIELNEAYFNANFTTHTIIFNT